MAWTIALVTSVNSTTDGQTFDFDDTNLTLTAGKTYIAALCAADGAAEADPLSLATTDASASFTKAAGFALTVANRNISFWYCKPGATLTGKTLRATLDDAGTGCIGILLSIDEATADPPHIVGNTKTHEDTDTDTTVTPDALQAVTSLQLAASLAGESSAQTLSGTGWAAAAIGASLTIGTPTVRFQVAKNDSGTANAVVFTGGTVARGTVSIEIAAGAATGHPTGRRFGLSLPQNTQHGIEGVRIF
jgi:hypothetical protein